MKTTYEVRCNLCNFPQAGLLYIKDNIHLVKCKDCGLVFNLEMKRPQDLSRIYSKDYFLGGDIGVGYDNYLSERSNHLRTFQRRFRFVDKYRKGGRLLSVGCAFGFCLEVARAKNWQTQGVEISRYAYEWARKNLNLDVHNSTLKDANFADNYFDAILMWGYIQESLDPLGEVKEAYRILKPGGMLFIQTQNVESRYARLTKEKWIQFKPKTTSFYFSRKTAKLLLEKGGFRILEITSSGIGQYCSFAFLITRILQSLPRFKKIGNLLGQNRFLKNTSIYINLFDFLHICAKKEEEAHE